MKRTPREASGNNYEEEEQLCALHSSGASSRLQAYKRASEFERTSYPDAASKFLMIFIYVNSIMTIVTILINFAILELLI